MVCYFNENHDLTYGTFEACLDEFIRREPEALRAALLPEIEAVNAAGCVLDILPRGSPERAFWSGLGGMRLTPRHVLLARQKLRSS